MEGQGTYIWADGRIYEGEWLANKQHGEGKYTDLDSTARRWRWKNGRRTSLIEQ